MWCNSQRTSIFVITSQTTICTIKIYEILFKNGLVFPLEYSYLIRTNGWHSFGLGRGISCLQLLTLLDRRKQCECQYTLTFLACWRVCPNPIEHRIYSVAAHSTNAFEGYTKIRLPLHGCNESLHPWLSQGLPRSSIAFSRWGGKTPPHRTFLFSVLFCTLWFILE